MQHAHSVARKHLEKSATRQKELYDIKVKLETYKLGSLIWFQTEMGWHKVAPKLRVPFEGAYLVTNAISESLYLIQLYKKGTMKSGPSESTFPLQRKPEAELRCIFIKEDKT